MSPDLSGFPAPARVDEERGPRAPRGPRLAAATAAAHLPIGWLLWWLEASKVEPESENGRGWARW